jgi:hypothetical protein
MTPPERVETTASVTRQADRFDPSAKLLAHLDERGFMDLMHALAHHGDGAFGPAGMLAVGYLTELEPRGWKARQSRTGAASWSFRRGSEQFHFRPGRSKPRGPIDAVIVKDRYQNGKIVATLRTRLDAIRFVGKLAR